MARNVEIKAKLREPDRQKLLAEQLSGEPGEIIEQEDVFFNCPTGRLKLRIFSDARGELIFYNRADQSGPKTSTYSISKTAEPRVLQNLLEQSLGTRAVVRKVRRLYITGRTRIHLDSVEGLGDFLELEVVLKESDDIAGGERELKNLMSELEIEASSLIENAYVDLLGGRTDDNACQ